MTVHMVHGWAEQDRGAGSIGSLDRYLEVRGLRREYHGHQWPRLYSLALLKQRRRTQQVADQLAASLKDGDSAVGFSNGNPIIRHALVKSGVLLNTWIAIAPALPRRIEIPLNCKRVIVMHSNGDWAVPFGRLWSDLWPPNLILGHDWGDMGRVGYCGGDDRVENWASRNDVSHGGWFDAEPMRYWGPRIADALVEAR